MRLAALVLAVSSVFCAHEARAAPATVKSAEALFLTARASHSVLEAEFLDVCKQKAQREELKTFCREQADVERQHASQYQTWFQNWFGGKTPKGKN